jgi:pyruvate dehydrogenase E2 component (dihydrolipoamide acetyltransferase)
MTSDVQEFRMPSLGADMETGTLVEWLVQPGVHVKRGQVIAVVETDKGAIDVEVWHDGIVDSLDVAAGTTVPVGAVLARLRAEGGAPQAAAIAAPPPAPAATVAPAPPAPPAAPAAPAAPAPPTPTTVRASPAARHLAHERGVDLSTVRGTGPSGAVVLADVEAALGKAPPVPAPAPAPAPPSPRPPAPSTDGMRRAIAAAMARSKREIPHYYLATDVDVAPALAWLAQHNAARPVAERVLPAAVILRAIAVALVDFPELRGHFVDGELRPGPVHVGVAVALRGGGLVAPAIHDADRLAVPELMRALTDVIQRARAGHLRASEVSDPTVTVTALGDLGVDSVFGVIYPPQVAIIGVGRVRERPWATGGLLGVRPVVTLTLAADHRVSDGLRGARFLARVGELLGRTEVP